MQYYIMHMEGRESYSLLVSIESGNTNDVIKKVLQNPCMDFNKDYYRIRYISEISKNEYEKIEKKSQDKIKWADGSIIKGIVFSDEDFSRAKELSYINWHKENTNTGFEYMGQWIVNPFVDPSGRFEFDDFDKVFECYGMKSDEICNNGKANAYSFILEILSKDYIRKKLEAYAGNKNPNGGIALHILQYEQIFTVSFGDGSNIDEEDGFDDYLYIMCYCYDECIANKIKNQDCEESDWQESLIEIDGGQYDFTYAETDYDEDITKAVYDALMHMYDMVPEFEPLSSYCH